MLQNHANVNCCIFLVMTVMAIKCSSKFLKRGYSFLSKHHSNNLRFQGSQTLLFESWILFPLPLWVVCCFRSFTQSNEHVWSRAAVKKASSRGRHQAWLSTAQRDLAWLFPYKLATDLADVWSCGFNLLCPVSLPHCQQREHSPHISQTVTYQKSGGSTPALKRKWAAFQFTSNHSFDQHLKEV